MRVSAPTGTILAVFLAFPAAAAPSAEGVHAAAEAEFLQALGRPESLHFVKMEQPQNQAGQPEANSLVHMHSPNPRAGGPSTLVKSIDMAALLNRHLKTNLSYTLGGVSVWISGAFDRKQDAYISVLIDGQAAQYFNVSELLTSPKFLDIGTGRYRLSLSPDLTDQLSSEIVLTNAANRRDQQRAQLRDMLDAIEAAGDSVAVGGQTYHCFYYDDVAGGTKSFAFILTDPHGEYHVFLIPSEIVPTGRPATFKMYENQEIGLQLAAGTLRILQ